MSAKALETRITLVSARGPPFKRTETTTRLRFSRPSFIIIIIISPYCPFLHGAASGPCPLLFGVPNLKSAVPKINVVEMRLKLTCRMSLTSPVHKHLNLVSKSTEIELIFRRHRWVLQWSLFKWRTVQWSSQQIQLQLSFRIHWQPLRDWYVNF